MGLSFERPVLRKGRALIFAHLGLGKGGNTSVLGDTGVSLGKGSLFFLTDTGSWKAVKARYESRSGKAARFLGCPKRLRRSLKTSARSLLAVQFVLITATGLQGVQPLVN